MYIDINGETLNSDKIICIKSIKQNKKKYKITVANGLINPEEYYFIICLDDNGEFCLSCDNYEQLYEKRNEIIKQLNDEFLRLERRLDAMIQRTFELEKRCKRQATNLRKYQRLKGK